MLQVEVAAPRVAGVVADARQFRQAYPGAPEHGDHPSVAAVLEAPVGARPLQLTEFIAGEDRDGLVRDGWWLQPGRGVGISSSAASHSKNCCRARNWLPAYAAL